MEQTNFRYLSKESVADEIDFASVDVSFISLRHIIPNLYNFLRDGACAVCLIKPQFEAGIENIGKNGIVKDVNIHKDVVCVIYRFVVESGFAVKGIDFSPIKGPKGNIEYLIHIQKNGNDTAFDEKRISEIVCDSHDVLNRGEA